MPDPTTSHHAPSSSFDAATTEAPALRSFYLFLFLFVVFDMLVIIASIIAQHYTVRSFDDSLARTDEVTHAQIVIQDVARLLVEVNAAGNDIFETGEIEWECERFLRSQAELLRRMRMIPADVVPLAALREAVDRMVEAETMVFEYFVRAQCEPPDSHERQRFLANAAASMAEMDRAQAVALAYLREANGRLLRRQQEILDQGKTALNQRWLVELAFVGVVAIVLGGVWLSWRQIQAMHEQIRLQHQRVEVERRNRLAAVGEVCFSVAHGIKNPVAAIVSSAQLLHEHGRMDETSRQRVRDILTVGRSLGARVNQLLDFSRVGCAKLERLQPQDILESAIREIGPQLESAGIRIERDLEPVDGLLLGDRHMLVQAILELLANARDALPHGGIIRLICKRRSDQAGWVDIGVADNGPGMTDDVKKRAFDLFFTRKDHGSGVGLASVRRTAELHAGTVSIRDVVPHGADVRMHLPLTADVQTTLSG